MLVAPIVVPGGFLNPLRATPGGAFDRSGVAIVAGAVGVSVVVSGVLAAAADGLRLELIASVNGALRSAVVQAPMGDLTCWWPAPRRSSRAGSAPWPVLRGRSTSLARTRTRLGRER
jgi:hypothetical protein